jgi:ArsR family transcriptional regulator
MTRDYCVGAPSTGGREAAAIVNDDDLARVVRALGHPARLSLVRLLARHDACTGTEVFSSLDLAQSTISEHLRVLGGAGLLSATPVGNRTCYCLVTERVVALGDALAGLLGDAQVCAASTKARAT